jgi:hypothetical protein
MHTCGGVVGAVRAGWNACVVSACFAVLADAAAGHLVSYDGDYVEVLLFGALALAGVGFVLTDYWMALCDSLEKSWTDQRRPQEVLMRRLGALREQVKISEEMTHFVFT